MPLLAEPFHEMNRDVAAIDALVEVEDQHLEQRLTAADRRPRADARDAVERRGTEAGYARRENAVDRRLNPLQVDVRGREAELPAEPQAAHDSAGDRVVAAEHVARRREIAGLERLADRGAAHALAFEVDGRHFGHAHAVARPERAQIGDRPRAIRAEA